MISQMEYDTWQSSPEQRETSAEREVRYLRRRLDEMEAEKHEMTVEQLEEKRLDEFYEKQAQRPAPETAASRAVRFAIEQAKAQQNSILAHYGVADDAEGNLKLVLCSLNTDVHSQTLFRSLIAAIVGADLGESTSLRDIVAWWPSLSPEVGDAIAELARHYAATYRSAASSRIA